MQHPGTSSANLTRYAWLSIAAAIVTISLKVAAYELTGSIGLLSDALESVVNLIAAIAALIALWVAAKEPDEEHAYGHAKAEYFSSGLEGLLVLLAAGMIVYTAVPRVFHPVELEKIGIGLAVSIVASGVNGAVAWKLFQAAKAHRSITLEADARHLVTDIWTSAGVVIGIALVAVTGWTRLDGIVALAVAANIIWVGFTLVRASMQGLLDTALPPDDLATINAILTRYREEYGVQTHALRTRQAGSRRFMSVHVLVPGDWTVQHGHHLVEKLELDVHEALPETTVFTHLESLDDPASWDDVTLDRTSAE